MRTWNEWIIYMAGGALCGYLLSSLLFLNNRLSLFSLFFVKVAFLLALTYAFIALAGGLISLFLQRLAHRAPPLNRPLVASDAFRRAVFFALALFTTLFFWHFDSFYAYSTFGFTTMMTRLFTESFVPTTPYGRGNLFHLSFLVLASLGAATLFFFARRALVQKGWLKPCLIAFLALALTAPWTVQVQRAWATSAKDDRLWGHPDTKALILAVDAVDWKLATEFIEAGLLPNLAALAKDGLFVPLATYQPAYSPMVWTSVATGMGIDHHNIRHFHAYSDGHHAAIQPLVEPSLLMGNPYILRLLGQLGLLERRSVTGNTRHVPAFWEITSQADLFTAVLGWWASAPAEPLNGILVTDYAAHTDGSHAALSPHVYPREALPGIARDVKEGRTPPKAWLQRLFSLTPAEADSLGLWGPQSEIAEVELSEVLRSLHHDYGHFLTAQRLIKAEQPEVLALFLEGIDTAGHTTLRYERGQDQSRLDPNKVRRYRHTSRTYYQIIDEMIGQLAQMVDDETHIFLLSDHGFHLEDPPNYFHHKSGPPGVLLINGPNIKPAAPLKDAHILDVLPTLLYTLGLPVAEDMEGRILSEAFTPDFTERFAVRTIATYGNLRPPIHRDGKLADGSHAAGEAMIHRLKALGYIE